VYGLVAAVAGCNPNVTVNVPSGGSGIIAIVDAYDDPEAAPDLAWFSLQFGIPLKVSQFQVVYASGFQPPVDYTGGWEMEESLDIEYAHAMAPSATIYLVEANSNSYSDLFTAVTVATNIIQCGNFSSTIGACTTVTGHGEVSMSWGSGEFAGETAYDTYFNQKNVVFLASSGDQPGPSYPATSPNVIAVGGTSTGRSLATGNTEWQTVWQDAGSGPSAYEAKPSYQSAITLASSRMTPDVAADANPATGVWVYDSFPTDGYFYSSSWWILGGTSVAAPVWAGILNNADTRHSTVPANTAAELTTLYTASASYFYDVHGTGATCGFYDTYAAGTGYDLCTGLGAPWTYNGK
jgi:subtilase family serine protease